MVYVCREFIIPFGRLVYFMSSLSRWFIHVFHVFFLFLLLFCFFRPYMAELCCVRVLLVMQSERNRVKNEEIASNIHSRTRTETPNSESSICTHTHRHRWTVNCETGRSTRTTFVECHRFFAAAKAAAAAATYPSPRLTAPDTELQSYPSDSVHTLVHNEWGSIRST